MESPRKTFLMIATITTVATIAFYKLWLEMLARMHGMPDQHLSHGDGMLALSGVLVMSLGSTVLARIIYSRADKPVRAAAVCAALGSLMSVCFAATQVTDEFAAPIFCLGLAAGIGGALIGLFAELDDRVGNMILLGIIMTQIILTTSFIP